MKLQHIDHDDWDSIPDRSSSPKNMGGNGKDKDSATKTSGSDECDNKKCKAFFKQVFNALKNGLRTCEPKHGKSVDIRFKVEPAVLVKLQTLKDMFPPGWWKSSAEFHRCVFAGGMDSAAESLKRILGHDTDEHLDAFRNLSALSEKEVIRNHEKEVSSLWKNAEEDGIPEEEYGKLAGRFARIRLEHDKSQVEFNNKKS